MELEITQKRALRFWWAIVWRSFVATLASMLIVSIVGFMVGFVLALTLSAIGVDSDTIQLIATPIGFFLGLAIGLACSFVAIKDVLGRKFGDFRVALVAADGGLR